MRKKSATRRLANYIYATNGDRVKLAIDSKRDSMISHQSEAVTAMTEVEDKTLGLLNSEPSVASCDLPHYYAAAKEMWAKQDRFKGGAMLNNEVAVIIAKWTMRGKVERILIRIRDEVFSIQAPSSE